MIEDFLKQQIGLRYQLDMKVSLEKKQLM